MRFDVHKKLWCEESPNIYEKLYSENVIIGMHKNNWVLNTELYIDIQTTYSENTRVAIENRLIDKKNVV